MDSVEALAPANMACRQIAREKAAAVAEASAQFPPAR
jgi:hypothetical protein